MKKTTKVLLSIKPSDKEAQEVAIILNKLAQLDMTYANKISDEVYQYQPFLLSLLMGDQVDLKPEEAGEMMRSYFILWEFYKNKPNIKNNKLTVERFEAQQKKNIHYFKYLETENKAGIDTAMDADFENIYSKALLRAMLLRFGSDSVLSAMEYETKTAALIGIKSLIECFDEIIK